MGRSCYLCNNKSRRENNISLHQFPKKNSKYIKIHQKWLNACGLNERDDVSQIYICTCHFDENHFGMRNKKIRLNPGAVPSIDVPNPTAQEKIIPPENFRATPEINEATEREDDVRADASSLSLNSHEYSDGEYRGPEKRRRFVHPRFISEIEYRDVATPGKARATLQLVKIIDKKKSKRIKVLQDENRRLKNRVLRMRRMMYHLYKVKMISRGDQVS